jgi:hypothetical protein
MKTFSNQEIKEYFINEVKDLINQELECLMIMNTWHSSRNKDYFIKETSKSIARYKQILEVYKNL